MLLFMQDNVDCDQEILNKCKGRRLVDVETLQNDLWCDTCNVALSIKNSINEHRCKLASIFTALCCQSQKTKKVHTDLKNREDKTYEVNSRLVFSNYLLFLKIKYIVQ